MFRSTLGAREAEGPALVTLPRRRIPSRDSVSPKGAERRAVAERGRRAPPRAEAPPRNLAGGANPWLCGTGRVPQPLCACFSHL